MKIRHLNTSLNGDASFSRKLGNAIISELQSVHPDSTVRTRDLAHESLPYFNETHRDSFYTPTAAHTSELTEAARPSGELIAEVMDADVLVIDTPMYNFTITSTLKSWIDHVARIGVTFRFTETGQPEGLLKNKKVYLAIASGSIYSDGPYKPFDFTEPYLRAILGFIGISDLTAFRVEGTMIPGHSEVALANAMATLKQFSFA